ncbi:MAG: hypothetical protein JSS66_13030 [Armatimonadetes bacterium]|nr:hypothetical protein [Armatimonadota bacterium]
MLRKSLFISALALAGSAMAQEGWYQVRVSVPDQQTLTRLTNSSLDTMDCVPHLGSADVAIGPGELSKLLAGRFQFTYVRPLEDPRNWEERHKSGSSIQVDDYRLHYFDADQILAFFENLRAQYPILVTRKPIGTTVNGEQMWAYRIGRPLQQGSLPINNIVIEGLIHAREWITGASIMHIGKMCVDGLTSPQPQAFMQNQAVWIVPMANPDGYRYTWTTYRLWRKNRKNNGGGIYGVDLNRNYSTGWGQNGGSSTNPDSETYRGTAPFSEPEAVAVQGLVNSVGRVGGFIDYHSYAQLILWPWSYTTTRPPDLAMFQNVAPQLETAMSSTGTNYDQGQCARILYIASGTSNDWVYDIYRKPAFGIELRDTGQFGFELPENQIFGTQDEVWLGFKKFLTIVGP